MEHIDGVLGALLLVLVTAIVVAVFAFGLGRNSITRDCEYLGAFEESKRVYDCKPRAKD